MLESALVAFTTLFVTVGPIDVAAVFAVLADRKATRSENHKIIIRGVIIATIILLLFAFLGNHILDYLGVSLSALQVAGGVLLFIASVDMVFAGRSDSTSANKAEVQDASIREDIAVFPLAMPLMSGPASIGTVILLMAKVKDDFVQQSVIIGVLLLIMLLCYLCLLIATSLRKYLGVTGLNIVGRIMGLLLAVLASQFVLDGLQTSLFS